MTQWDSDRKNLLKLVQPWQVSEAGTLLETPIFALCQRNCASVTTANKAGTFYYLDTTDWVNVIALTADRHVVLVEQFRHGRKEVTLEVPGGMVDPGEEPLAAGLRELREESGYVGTGAQIIGAVSPNPAILNNLCHTVLVRDVTPRHQLALDGNEEIAVRLIPLDEIGSLIRDGMIHHALVVAAFHHLSLLPNLP